ncbi:uncharacterized protein LOC114212077 [Eumetopias jubatus]|uniref:uncharacterized protein LOC114212077 n=1 Tax=Eumetopias jubatus TaxID=34886 RepID=UPI0010172098|nr:uncharacterized protein LOC114212077 [Eumetopias jubatus]
MLSKNGAAWKQMYHSGWWLAPERQPSQSKKEGAWAKASEERRLSGACAARPASQHPFPRRTHISGQVLIFPTSFVLRDDHETQWVIRKSQPPWGHEGGIHLCTQFPTDCPLELDGLLSCHSALLETSSGRLHHNRVHLLSSVLHGPLVITCTLRSCCSEPLTIHSVIHSAFTGREHSLGTVTRGGGAGCRLVALPCTGLSVPEAGRAV